MLVENELIFIKTTKSVPYLFRLLTHLFFLITKGPFENYHFGLQNVKQFLHPKIKVPSLILKMIIKQVLYEKNFILINGL